MCILPNRSTQGPTPTGMTIREAIAEAWRGGRWYDNDDKKKARLNEQPGQSQREETSKRLCGS